LSGPGVGRGASTFACAVDTAASTDDFWWINQAQRYYLGLASESLPPGVSGVSVGACADYDGDGKADPAIYDETIGTWKIKFSSSDYYMITTMLNGLGGNGYTSVSADYDGDRLADPAVYYESIGIWIILLSSSEYAAPIVLPQSLGGLGYSGMPADYDGDSRDDPGIFRLDSGLWAIRGMTPILLGGWR